MRKGIQVFSIGNTPAEVRITHARRSTLYFARIFFKEIKISSSQDVLIDRLTGMKEAHKRNYGKGKTRWKKNRLTK